MRWGENSHCGNIGIVEVEEPVPGIGHHNDMLTSTQRLPPPKRLIRAEYLCSGIE